MSDKINKCLDFWFLFLIELQFIDVGSERARNLELLTGAFDWSQKLLTP